MPSLDSEALDFRSFRVVRCSPETDLPRPGNITARYGALGAQRTDRGGMILFGKDRERHFPDAWIQGGRFAGTSKSQIIDRTEIRSLPAQAHEVGGIVFGSADLSASFIRHGLYDEYRIGHLPMTLGEGVPLFKPGSEPLRLELKQSCPIGERCHLLGYQPADAAAAAGKPEA